jgi:hypothetical protein
MPTSTNLSLVTPASTDYVTNGATAMTTLANGVDAYWAAMTTYTPTLTNVTGGSVGGRFVRMGKLGLVSITITAGTATANGNLTATLPAGWTSHRVQPIPALLGNAVVGAFANSATTTVTLTKDAAGTTFTAGNNVFTYRLMGWIELT